MKFFLILSVLFASGLVLAELPVSPTSYRKAMLDVVEASAEKGIAEAQLELALRYYAGHQVKQDFQKAFQWMHLSAEQQYSESLYLLSRMYAEGVGTRKNVEKEELWFAKALAADPKNEELQLLYAQYLSDSRNTQAFLQKCADAGYVPAFLETGLSPAMKFYNEGEFADALLLFLQLMDHGSPEAAYYAGRIYADGRGNLQVDQVEAFVCFQKAAQGGYALAQFELARMYAEGVGTPEDPEQATFWYEVVAENGHEQAQYQTAELEFHKAVAAESVAASVKGEGTKFNDYKEHLKKAVTWYRAAAEQGHVEALYALGRLFASGEGVRRDYDEAVRFYRAAAEKGHAEAVFYLGLMHHAGLGGEKNLPAAIEHYEKAADEGVSGALYYLANCYRFGEGLEKHPLKGESLYYGKMLKDQSDPKAVLSSDEWVLSAAREYGIIRWNRAASLERLLAASSWVGMAAQNGDETAQKTFSEMKEQYGRDAQRELFPENRVDPKADAMEKRRSFVFFPYVQWDVEDLYENSEARQPIIAVRTGGSIQKNVAGDDVDGVFVRYVRPATSRAHGFSGILLAGLEFTDRKTGERYWSFAEWFDTEPTYYGKSVYNLYISVDMAAYPDAKLTGWSVVYGHLLPDGRTIAVFDTREFQSDSLVALYKKNRYSKGVPNHMGSYIEFESVIDIKEPIQKTPLIDLNLDL